MWRYLVEENVRVGQVRVMYLFIVSCWASQLMYCSKLGLGIRSAFQYYTILTL